MKKSRLLTALILTIGLVLFYVQPVLADQPPPMPSSFYGTVKLDGANVPADTVVSAQINGVVYAHKTVLPYNGNMIYSLDIPGDQSGSSAIEGGVGGDTIVFYIGSIQATQTGIWHSGTNVSLNITGFSNHAPTDIGLSNSSVAENSPINTVVGTLSSTDPDVGDTFTYTLVSGNGDTDNASFNISGSDLQTSAVFDYETKSSYSVRIRTTDQGGLYYEKAFTITVTDVNDAPMITESDPQAVSMSENGNPIAFSLTLHATDADTGDTLTWSIISPASHGIAGASGTGFFMSISYTPNNDYIGSDSFLVQVSDDHGRTDTITVNVTINAVKPPSYTLFLPIILH